MRSLTSIFKDSHHFTRTLGCVWRQFFFWNSHHFSRTLGSVSRQSLRTAITSAEIWAVFDDSFERQASLQQTFGQCMMTVFNDTVFNDNAFLKRTLRGRFREKRQKVRATMKQHHKQKVSPDYWNAAPAPFFGERCVDGCCWVVHKLRETASRAKMDVDARQQRMQGNATR